MPLLLPTDRKNKKPTFRLGRLFWIGLFLFFIILTSSFSILAVVKKNQGKIISGVRIGIIDVGGKTAAEASSIIEARIDEIFSKGFTVYIENKKTVIKPIIVSPDDPDLSRELAFIDRSGAVAEAYNIGRSKNFIKNLRDYLKTRFIGIAVKVPAVIGQKEFENIVKRQLSESAAPAKNAALDIKWDKETGKPLISIRPEQSGAIIETVYLRQQLESKLSLLEIPEISLSLIEDKPSIYAHEAVNIPKEAETVLSGGPWILRHKDKIWESDAEKFSSFLSISKTSGDQIVLTANSESLDNLFNDIEQAVNVPPINAKFTIDNGKVVEFQNSVEGIVFDRVKTKNIIDEIFIKNNANDADIIVGIIEPEITTAKANNLGIEKILGVGKSSFGGSPINRIKNIENGVRMLNGTLVKPDEEFSLLAVLRPFTKENGYLNEKVIKGDKIEPEIAGGLCQIGTTTFRATMNSGLPITERRNHSLVVSYYNDPKNGNPGTDATIYDPSPDFKFKNDTGSYILITALVNKTNQELEFSFWGKDDGRKGSYSPPIVDRRIPAGEPQQIETADLEPGKKKCQHAYPGADTHFTYTIERPDGAKNETVFTSHYRALPEICLVGVDPNAISETATAPNAASDLSPEERADAVIR